MTLFAAGFLSGLIAFGTAAFLIEYRHRRDEA